MPDFPATDRFDQGVSYALLTDSDKQGPVLSGAQAVIQAGTGSNCAARLLCTWGQPAGPVIPQIYVIATWASKSIFLYIEDPGSDEFREPAGV